MRARALRAPVILGSLPRQTGRCAPPTHRSFAAFSSYSKIKIIYLTRAARVKGLFLSTLLPRPESTQSARPSIQSSALGPPTPSTAKECGSPTLDPGGRHTHIRMRGWGGGNQFRRWGTHSGTPAPHVAASLIFPANNNRKKPQKITVWAGWILRYQ